MKATGVSNEDRNRINEDIWMIVSLHMWQKSDRMGLVMMLRNADFTLKAMGQLGK